MTLRETLRGWMRRPRREPPVWYHPDYRLPLSGLEGAKGVEPRRADFVAWYLVESGWLHPDALRKPRRVSYAEMARVHTPALLASLHDPATLGNVFGADPSDVPVDEVLRTVRLAAGGTLQAVTWALETGRPALNLLGGFHHASPSVAGGFCPINDIAIAIAAVRAGGFAGRVVVIDVDAHPPDGTAECLRDDPSAWIGSLSGSRWTGLPGVDETVLPEGCGDEAYLAALDGLLSRMPAPALAIVVAGGDVLANDHYGVLGMTLEGVRERDRRIHARLEGLPAVWLPGGGYRRDAWKILAGTALTLAGLGDVPVGDADPMRVHVAQVSRTLTAESLGAALGSDVAFADELALGSAGRAALLGFYSAEGIEHALWQYGVLAHLERLGFRGFRVEIHRTGAGDSMRLHGRDDHEEHLLFELVVERKSVGGESVLFVNWLTLRNPKAAFSERRPQLPGQEVPGLGLAREAGELLARMAARMGWAGVAFRPAWYHTAYAARADFRFVDPARQGRFEAMMRDLQGVPLLDVTRAVHEKRVLLDGRPYEWEADDMVYWLSPHAMADGELVAASREASGFRLVAPRS